MSEQLKVDSIFRARAAAQPNIKIPEFTPEGPELWIGQVDLQFAALEISIQGDKIFAPRSKFTPCPGSRGPRHRVAPTDR